MIRPYKTLCNLLSEKMVCPLNNKKIRTSAEEEVYKFARASVVADKNLKTKLNIDAA